ncbi:MAG: ABC transporter permease [Ilumatobacteraceae bacterium]
MSSPTTVAASMAGVSPDELGPTHLGPAHEPAPSSRVQLSKIVAPMVLLAVFIGVWYMMHYWGLRFFFDKDGRRLVPTPLEVWDQTIKSSIPRRKYIEGVKWTSIVAFGGLVITIVIGCSLAVLMSQARWVEGAVYPYLVALQAVPILAVIPLIYSVFGGGLTPRFFVCIMIAFFPIVTNTLFGLNSADPDQHDLFTLRNASRWTRLVKLQLPSALPNIFTGFRISAGLSVIGAVVGEQFFRSGSKPGVGIVMDNYRVKGIYAPLYGGVVIACLLGIFTFLFFGWLSKLAIGSWYESGKRKT